MQRTCGANVIKLSTHNGNKTNAHSPGLHVYGIRINSFSYSVPLQGAAQLTTFVTIHRHDKSIEKHLFICTAYLHIGNDLLKDSRQCCTFFFDGWIHCRFCPRGPMYAVEGCTRLHSFAVKELRARGRIGLSLAYRSTSNWMVHSATHTQRHPKRFIILHAHLTGVRQRNF